MFSLISPIYPKWGTAACIFIFIFTFCVKSLKKEAILTNNTKKNNSSFYTCTIVTNIANYRIISGK